MVKAFDIHDNKFFIIGIAIVILDQITKYFAKQLTESIVIIPRIFSLTLVKNEGIAFGMLQGFISIPVWASIMAIGFSLYYYNRLNNLGAISLGLIFGGTIGNLIDRMLLGAVIDFFNFHIWPVFNIADIALTIGSILLIISIWKFEKEEII